MLAQVTAGVRSFRPQLSLIVPKSFSKRTLQIHVSSSPYSRLTSARANNTAASRPTGLEIAPWTNSPQNQEALTRLLNRFESLPGLDPTEDEAKWFLRDRNFDVEEAYTKLVTCLRWRKEFNVHRVRYESVKREADTGKAYLHEHQDIYGRPVLVIRVSKHVIGQFTERQSQELCTYFIEQAIAARPEGIDTVMGIFDLKGFTIFNADFNFVRFLIQAFFNYYPKMAGEVLMVDAPSAFLASYELMRPALGKYGNLIRFVKRAEVARYFSPEAVPNEFR
eukprot:jgi/Ulvmu1/347/UM001_0352.1